MPRGLLGIVVPESGLPLWRRRILSQALLLLMRMSQEAEWYNCACPKRWGVEVPAEGGALRRQDFGDTRRSLRISACL